MTLIWIRIRKAAMCGRVPRETQKKPLWLPHRPHANKHWLQRTTQTDHKCAGAGAVLCLSSRRNTLVGGLLDSEAGARAALKEEGFSQRPQSRLEFCASSRVYWNSLLGSTSVPPHMLESLPISDWKHAPAQHHPNHLLSIHTRFTQVAQLPSSLHLLVSSSPSLQLFPQQSHPKLQPSQESCPGAHGCLLD